LERLRRCGLVSDGKFGDRFVFPTGYLLFPFYGRRQTSGIFRRVAQTAGAQWRWLCLSNLLPPVFNQSALCAGTATISICEGVSDVISAHELGMSAIGLVGANARLDDEDSRLTSRPQRRDFR
jgi:DNA primase